MPDFSRARRDERRLGEAPHALYPPESLDKFDRFLAGVNLQHAVEVAHVGAHGVVGHVELAGNAALAVPLGKKERYVCRCR